MSDQIAGDAGQAMAPESLLRLVADSVPALMAYYEKDTLRCRFANRRYAEYTGWTPQTILGKTLREIVGEATNTLIEPHVKTVLGGQPVHYVREQTLPDGGRRMIEVSLLPHFAEDGVQVGAFVLINDITEHWRIEQALRDSEQRLRKFAEATNEGILFHKDGLIADVNPALQRMSGYVLDELVGRSVLEFVPEIWQPVVLEHMRTQDEMPYEAEIVHKNGHLISVEMVGKNVPYEGTPYRMAVVRDITQRKQAQARIEFLAMHDMLTELPNRRYLDEYMPRLLALARRQDKSLAMLFVDLDSFKDINDNQGHAAGDAALREVARRLRASVRESDLVVRLGGDEFLVMLTDLEQAGDVTRAVEQLVNELRAPALINGQAVRMHASIGISLFPEHGQTVDELIKCADAAMYDSKNAGGDRYTLFQRPEPV